MEFLISEKDQVRTSRHVFFLIIIIRMPLLGQQINKSSGT